VIKLRKEVGAQLRNQQQEQTDMAKKSVTHFKAIEEAAQRGEKIWVGVDVHIKSHAVAILSETGVRHSFVTSSNNQVLGVVS
jgi:hypothetical protein